MKRLICVLLMAALLLPSPPGLSEKGHFIRNVRKEPKTGEKITYWVYEPPEVTEGLPLVIYLHGSSERGENALATSLPLFIKEGKAVCDHALLLVPQLPKTFGKWSYVEPLLMEIIDELVASYGIDESRIALTGFSLGGLGVWDMAGHYPGRFTRVMPVSGRINEEIFIDAFEMCQLKTYVGTRDDTVDPATSIAFTQAVIDAGYDAELIQLDSTHNLMPYKVFKNADALAWIWMEKGDKRE